MTAVSLVVCFVLICSFGIFNKTSIGRLLTLSYAIIGTILSPNIYFYSYKLLYQGSSFIIMLIMVIIYRAFLYSFIRKRHLKIFFNVSLS